MSKKKSAARADTARRFTWGKDDVDWSGEGEPAAGPLADEKELEEYRKLVEEVLRKEKAAQK